ncbi:hypothetical protein [Natroniella sp. ANB-PHB2]|uniref:recombination directionality factor n=1 Tax=Natroniella sp. ANB-PHB2 TaxID=3384444 RepID=UPI0038D39D90
MINGIEGLNGVSEIEIGKIKTGEKNKKGYPSKLDYFKIVRPTKKGKNYELDPVMEQLPDKPKRLDITLAHDDIDKNFLNYFAYYQGYNDLKCRGNGQRAIVDGEKEVKCNGSRCKYWTEGKCKPNGILKVSLKQKPSLVGYYFYRTTSWNSVKRIKESLNYISQVTNGILAGINLKLVLKEERNDHGNMYIAHIEYPGTVLELRKEAVELARAKKELQELNSNNRHFSLPNQSTSSKSEEVTAKVDNQDDISDEVKMITGAQRKKIFAMIGKITDWMEKQGVNPNKEKVRKQLMKDFSAAEGEKLESLSSDKCTYEQADKFISWLEDKSKVVKDENFKLEVVESA